MLNYSLAILLALLVPLNVLAQDVDEEDIFEMSLFEINTEKDYGYRATTAVTATRIGAEIINTPLKVQVVSEEFLKDLKVDNLIDAFNYTSGVSTTPDQIIRVDGIRLRGFEASFVLRDGYQKPYFNNLDGVDRIEVVKGPVAAFFGRAEPGGLINYITKKPLFHWAHSLEGTLGSDAKYKALVDSSGPILKEKLAYRVVASYEDSESWKQDVEWEKKYVLAGLTWRPNDKVEFHVDYEYSHSDRRGGTNTMLIVNPDYINDYDPNMVWDTDIYNVDEDVRYPTLEFPNPRSDPNSPYYEEGWPAVQPPLLTIGNSQVSMTNERNAGQARIGYTTTTFWKNLQAGMSIEDAFVPEFSAYYAPLGRSWNKNGKGSQHLDYHHAASFEFRWTPVENFSIRYGANYLENNSYQLQPYNSDTRQDGYTLSPGQGFQSGGGPIAGAGAQSFFNVRATHQLDFALDLDFFGAQHTFLVAIEYRDDEFRSYNRRAQEWFRDLSYTYIDERGREKVKRGGEVYPGIGIMDIFIDEPPNVSEWVLPVDPMDWTASSTRHTEEGYGLVYQGKWFEERVNVMSGIRYETRSTRLISPDGGRGTATMEGGTTPMVGVNYRVMDGIVLYASYSESFQPPNRQNPAFYSSPDDLTVEVPVDELENETGMGYEFGVKTDWMNNKISGSVTVFHVEKDNIVVRNRSLEDFLEEAYELGIENGLYSRAPAVPDLYQNSGLEVTEGLELDLVFTPMNNYQLVVSWAYYWEKETKEFSFEETFGDTGLSPKARGDGPYPHPTLYLWNDGYGPDTGVYFDEDGVPQHLRPKLPSEYDGSEVFINKVRPELENTPDHQFAIWNKYTFTEGVLDRLSLGLGFHYESSTAVNQRIVTTYRAPAAWVWDAMVAYEMDVLENPLQLTLNVRNVFDLEYEKGTFGPGAPREWIIGIKYSF